MHDESEYKSNHWPVIGLGLAMLVLLATLIFLGTSVRKQLDALRTAPHDNIQWTLAQLDVEHSRLALAASLAGRSPDTSLVPLRQRFDLYYSRAQTVSNMQFGPDVVTSNAFYQHLAMLHTQIDALAVFIDQPDPLLRAEIPELQSIIDAQFGLIRKIALNAIKMLSTASDARSASLSKLLFQTVLVSTLLAIVLLMAFVSLQHAKREAERARETLSLVTNRLRSTIGASLDAVLVLDHTGKLLDCNSAAEEVFGYDRGEVLDRNIADFFVPEAQRTNFIAHRDAYLKTGQSSLVNHGLVQLEGRTKTGEAIPIEVSIASVEEEKKSIFIAFVRDISERKAADEAILRSRDEALAAAKSRSDFIAVMSHEMRTPLNGVIAAHDILSTTELTPHQEKFLTIAKISGDHLLQHVNDVLDISSIDANTDKLRKSVFDPISVIQSVLDSNQPLAKTRRNTLTSKLPKEARTCYSGDESRLRRILLNLVGNAIKFTENGSITVEATYSDGSNGDDLLEVRVIDTGRGIPADKLDAIFSDFVRIDAGFDRDTNGTGLGLSITKRMVQALRGEVGVESNLGSGSTFWVRIPLKPCTESLPAETSAKTTPAPTDKWSGQVALVVEDNAINRTIMEQFLQEFGFEISTAVNGLDGLRMACNTAYDIIFMDVSMPVMDGLTATRALREAANNASKSARIIGFTAHSNPDSLAQCRAAGMDDVLLKPVKRTTLTAVLEKNAPKPTKSTKGIRTNSRSAKARKPAASPLVDTQQINDVRTLLGPDKFREVCAHFQLELRESFDIIMSANSDASADQQVGRIHRTAGLCASMGAIALHRRLQSAQQFAASGDAKSLHSELTRAAAELGPTLQASDYAP
jgi:PAS domain S-box-containing protein